MKMMSLSAIRVLRNRDLRENLDGYAIRVISPSAR